MAKEFTGGSNPFKKAGTQYAKDQKTIRKLNKIIPVKKKVKRKVTVFTGEHLKGKSYQEFLNSKYWKIVRSQILKRDNNCCVICKSTYRLSVHHNTYKNHFNEHLHLEDLMTLCWGCHKEHHYAQQ